MHLWTAAARLTHRAHSRERVSLSNINGLLAAINRVELHALRICIFYVYIQQICKGGHLLIHIETSATLERKKPVKSGKKSLLFLLHYLTNNRICGIIYIEGDNIIPRL